MGDSVEAHRLTVHRGGGSCSPKSAHLWPPRHRSAADRSGRSGPRLDMPPQGLRGQPRPRGEPAPLRPPPLAKSRPAEGPGGWGGLYRVPPPEDRNPSVRRGVSCPGERQAPDHGPKQKLPVEQRGDPRPERPARDSKALHNEASQSERLQVGRPQLQLHCTGPRPPDRDRAIGSAGHYKIYSPSHPARGDSDQEVLPTPQGLWPPSPAWKGIY